MAARVNDFIASGVFDDVKRLFEGPVQWKGMLLPDTLLAKFRYFGVDDISIEPVATSPGYLDDPKVSWAVARLLCQHLYQQHRQDVLLQGSVDKDGSMTDQGLKMLCLWLASPMSAVATNSAVQEVWKSMQILLLDLDLFATS